MKTNNTISAFGRLSDRVELSVSPNADLYTDETYPVPRKASEDSSAEKDYTLYPCDLKLPEQTDSQLEDHVHIGFVA